MFSFSVHIRRLQLYSAFFVTDTATTDIYTLSLHDALPICLPVDVAEAIGFLASDEAGGLRGQTLRDRKSTRLNSSHVAISYAVFCLKKKKKGADYKGILSKSSNNTQTRQIYEESKRMATHP